MHVQQIWKYPVKSMIGATVHFTDLDATGLVGDRVWALRERERNIVANTRQTPGIMQLAAATAPGGEVVITLADGRTVRSDDSDAAAVLSAALGRDVVLESLRPADDLDYYRRKVGEQPADPMAELRGIFGREGDEPLPDFAKFGPNIMEFETPPGTFYDCYPLMILTTSALRSMSEALPGSVVDVRRFRPSLVIDTGDEAGHPEFDWNGRRFAVGTAIVEVINDCPRCAAITKEISPDIPQDRAILRHVVKDLGQAVGAYASVVQPGTVREGDEFVPL
jgi:uncharacterized protein YcbX